MFPRNVLWLGKGNDIHVEGEIIIDGRQRTVAVTKRDAPGTDQGGVFQGYRRIDNSSGR